MLKVMRDSFHHLKWVLIAVVAAFVFGFVFIDMGLGGGGVSGAPDAAFAARVNGETISYNDYFRSMKNLEEMYSQMYGQQFTPGMAQSMGLPTQVLSSLVDQRLLTQEAERLNLTATSEEVRRKLLSIPTFSPDGKFVGMELYTRYVTGPLGYPSAAAFEEDLAREITLNKMDSALMSSLVVSPKAAEAEYRRANENAKIRLVILPAAQQPAAISVTPAEVEAYYKANAGKFTHGEQRQARYLLADYAKIRATVKPVEADIRAAYDKAKENYRTPGAAKVQHILVKVAPGAGAEVEAAAKQKADTIVQQLRGGASFAALAKQHSEDPSSAAVGGEMGWVEMGQTVEPFERAIFSVPLNTISEPIRSPEYGFHIVRVTERRDAGFRPFEEVRAELENSWINEKAMEAARAEITRLATMMKQNKPSSVETFTGYANDKVTSNTTGWFGRGDTIEGVGSNPSLAQWIFSAQPGEVSPEAIGTQRGPALFYVTGARPAGTTDLAEIRPKVEQEARLSKGREAALASLKQMLSGAASIDAVAQQAGQPAREASVSHQTGVVGLTGDVTPIVQAAMSTEPGKVVGPFVVNEGAVAFQVVEQKKVTPEELAQNRESFMAQLREQQARNLRTVLVQRLRKNAQIELNDEITRPTSRPAGV